MAREQIETATGTREDRADPGMTVADLVASVATGTSSRGVVYILSEQDYIEPIYVMSEGYSQDANLVLRDRERFFTRRGRWNNFAQQSVNTVSLTVGSGRSRMDIGSKFTVFVG